MATQTTVTLVDDLDGSEAVESVAFALDGVSYEIDLSEDNAEKLRDALAGYVAGARRVDGNRRAGRAGLGPAASHNDPRPSGCGWGSFACRGGTGFLDRHRPAPTAAVRPRRSPRHGGTRAAAGALECSGGTVRGAAIVRSPERVEP